MRRICSNWPVSLSVSDSPRGLLDSLTALCNLGYSIDTSYLSSEKKELAQYLEDSGVVVQLLTY